MAIDLYDIYFMVSEDIKLNFNNLLYCHLLKSPFNNKFFGETLSFIQTVKIID